MLLEDDKLRVPNEQSLVTAAAAKATKNGPRASAPTTAGKTQKKSAAQSGQKSAALGDSAQAGDPRVTITYRGVKLELKVGLKITAQDYLDEWYVASPPAGV